MAESPTSSSYNGEGSVIGSTSASFHTELRHDVSALASSLVQVAVRVDDNRLLSTLASILDRLAMLEAHCGVPPGAVPPPSVPRAGAALVPVPQTSAALGGDVSGRLDRMAEEQRRLAAAVDALQTSVLRIGRTVIEHTSSTVAAAAAAADPASLSSPESAPAPATAAAARAAAGTAAAAAAESSFDAARQTALAAVSAPLAQADARMSALESAMAALGDRVSAAAAAAGALAEPVERHEGSIASLAAAATRLDGAAAAAEARAADADAAREALSRRVQACEAATAAATRDASAALQDCGELRAGAEDARAALVAARQEAAARARESEAALEALDDRVVALEPLPARVDALERGALSAEEAREASAGVRKLAAALGLAREDIGKLGNALAAMQLRMIDVAATATAAITAANGDGAGGAGSSGSGGGDSVARSEKAAARDAAAADYRKGTLTRLFRYFCFIHILRLFPSYFSFKLCFLSLFLSWTLYCLSCCHRSG